MATYQDISTALFVFLEKTPGLQMADKGSTTSNGVEQTANFIPLAPIENATIVLAGSHLNRFAEVWRSAFHRVCITQPAGCPTLGLEDRYSIAFFATADKGTKVSSTNRKQKFDVDDFLHETRMTIFK